MSGISGIWNLDSAPVSAEVLSAMSARLRHRGSDGEARRIDADVGFACQHRWVSPEEHGERQPLVARRASSSVMLVFDGRIDNRDQLACALRASSTLTDAGLVLAAYAEWGQDFANRLNGDFAAAIFDARERRLLLVRDPIGVRPLYYFHTSRLFAFASEIKGLLAHPDITPCPDDEGVADFMLVGSRPLNHQDLTCFQGISSVVPSHLVVVTPDRLATRRYWDFDTCAQVRFRTYGEYVDAFRERYVEAVKRRMRSAYPVAISVSGGLDSSSVFCEAETLRRAGKVIAPSIAGVSYVSDLHETDEQRFLCEIEERFGVTFDRFSIEPRTGLVSGAEHQITSVEAPFVDYLWGVTNELHTRAAASGARSILSGHWGDQMLFSTAYLIDLLFRGAWATIWQHTRGYARYFGRDEPWMRRRLLLFDAMRHSVPRAIAPPLKWLRLRFFERRPPKAWFSTDFLAAALRHRYRLATFDRPFHSAHARAVYVEARSKYQVQCMEWNNKVSAAHGLDAAFPFLDRDLIAFLMAIPGEIHARDGVPRVLLREAMRGVMPDCIRARTWKSDFSPFVNMGLRQDAEAILRTLDTDCLSVRLGYLDATRLRPELARLSEGLTRPDCVDSWELADTYGLEMWLRVFWPQCGNGLPGRHRQRQRT
jgi:asparagine synthase (glutamine-hydrolysing)